MKVAVLGDIHGNIDALRAVLKDVEEEGISHLLIAGDIVGYYYYPDEVLNTLSKWHYELIQGNHDGMLGEIDVWKDETKETYRKKYGSALEYSKKILSEKDISSLRELPPRKNIRIDNRSILLCHGSPWDRDEYLYPDAPIETLKKCTKYDADIVIMGHTHYPMKKTINSTLLLNPGSVGQPRNNQIGASWAILVLDNLNVELCVTPYNVEKLLTEVRKRDPDVPYLIDVFRRGRKDILKNDILSRE